MKYHTERRSTNGRIPQAIELDFYLHRLHHSLATQDEYIQNHLQLFKPSANKVKLRTNVLQYYHEMHDATPDSRKQSHKNFSLADWSNHFRYRIVRRFDSIRYTFRKLSLTIAFKLKKLFTPKYSRDFLRLKEAKQRLRFYKQGKSQKHLEAFKAFDLVNDQGQVQSHSDYPNFSQQPERGLYRHRKGNRMVNGLPYSDRKDRKQFRRLAKRFLRDVKRFFSPNDEVGARSFDHSLQRYRSANTLSDQALFAQVKAQLFWMEHGKAAFEQEHEFAQKAYTGRPYDRSPVVPSASYNVNAFVEAIPKQVEHLSVVTQAKAQVLDLASLPFQHISEEKENVLSNKLKLTYSSSTAGILQRFMDPSISPLLKIQPAQVAKEKEEAIPSSDDNQAVMLKASSSPFRSAGMFIPQPLPEKIASGRNPMDVKGSSGPDKMVEVPLPRSIV